MMFWNSSADSIICEKPPYRPELGHLLPRAQHQRRLLLVFGGEAGGARSLYLKQLEERLAKDGPGPKSRNR